MTGAIEFMRAWTKICVKQTSCDNCPIDEVCSGFGFSPPDEEISELVRQVMAEDRKKVDAE